MADWYDRNALGEDDHYTQPGTLFRHGLTDTDRQHLVHNIVASMQGITGSTRDTIIVRQLCHFCRADLELVMGVAAGLGMEMDHLLPTETVSASRSQRTVELCTWGRRWCSPSRAHSAADLLLATDDSKECCRQE